MNAGTSGKRMFVFGLAAVTATALAVLPTYGVAREKADWGKVAWVPLKGPSPWKEWQWNPKKEGRTWKYVEELTPAEREYWEIDPRWAHEIPRDKEYRHLPEERYPFKLPYSGEEISALGESAGGSSVMCGLQSHHGYHLTRKRDRLGIVTKSDTICSTVKHFKTFAEKLYELKPGQEEGSWVSVVVQPPETSGTVTLSKFYNSAPGVNKFEDRWNYSPKQRRVRRVAGASGSDYTSGGVSTFDDSFTRAFWMYDSKVIGVDILYQTVNGNRKPYGDIKGPYRQDGGVECYVVLHKHYDKSYYLSQWVTWHEKKTLHVIRQEQWSRNGNFKNVSEKAIWVPVSYFGKTVIPWQEAIKGGLGENGAERRAILHGGGQSTIWDVEQDIQSFSLGDTPDTKIPIEKFGPLSVYPQGESWKSFFQPQRIENPYLKPVPVVSFTAKDFPPSPPLYREKFAKYRRITLPSEVLKRIKKEELNRRSLF